MKIVSEATTVGYDYEESRRNSDTEKVREKYTEKNQMVKCVYSISLRIQLSLLPSRAARNVLWERRCKTSLPAREGWVAFASYSTMFHFNVESLWRWFFTLLKLKPSDVCFHSSNRSGH